MEFLRRLFTKWTNPDNEIDSANREFSKISSRLDNAADKMFINANKLDIKADKMRDKGFANENSGFKAHRLAIRIATITGKF
jgi:hypothetical protein